MEKHSSGTAGHGDYYAKQRYFLDEGDSSNQVDALNIQIEDHRLKLLDEISKLVKGSNDDNSSSDLSSQQRDKNKKSKPEKQLTQKDALICTNLQNLNIDFDVNAILKLGHRERGILKDKIVQFHDVIKRQRKYINIENLDNESKSEYDEEIARMESQNSEDLQQSNERKSNLVSQKISEDDEESDSHCDGRPEEETDQIRFEAIESPSLRDIKKPLSIGSAKKLSLPPMKANPAMLGLQQRRGSQNSVRSIRSDEKSKKFLVEKLSERSGGVQRQ